MMKMTGTAVKSVFLLTLALFITASNSQLSTFFTKNEIGSVKASAMAAVNQPTSLNAVYHAAKILESTKVSGFACNCASIGSLVKDASTSLDVYYGLMASNKCGCSINPPSDVQAITNAGLKSDLLFEVAGSALLGKVAGISVNGADVVNKIKSFVNADGRFLASLRSKETSIEMAKLALLALGEYKEDSSKAVLAEIADNGMALLPTGEDEFPVDPTVLAPLNKLMGQKPRLVGPRLVAVAESLLQLRHSGKLEVLASLLDSMEVIMSYKATPVFVSFVSSIVKADALSKSLVIDVVNSMGDAVTAEAIEVKALMRAGRDSKLFSGPLQGNVLDLSSIDGIIPGLYTAELAVTVPNNSKPVVVKVNFVVQGKLEVSDVLVGVTTSKDAFDSELTSVTAQNGVGGLSGSAASNNFVHVGFSLSTPSKSGKRFQKPHQVFVKFTHVETGTNSYFVGGNDGQLEGAVGSKFRAVVSLAKETETFMHLSGTYTISILAADVAYSEPVEWVVGSAELTFPAKAQQHFPLYVKPLLHDSDNSLGPLPEIAHQMRPPAKRASAFMATVFTAAVWAPLAGFVLYVLSLHPNLARLKSLSSLCFVACLVAALLLYLGYWLSIDGFSFYDTIRYLCFMLPITVVVGSYAIPAVTQARLEETKKA